MMRNKKAVLIMWQTTVILILTALTVAALFGAFFKGFRLGYNPLRNAHTNLATVAETMKEGDITFINAKLVEGDALIGFNSQSNRIDFTFSREGNVVRSTFYTRPPDTQCREGEACLCRCEQFDTDLSEGYRQPLPLQCKKRAQCIPIRNVDFPSEIQCEQLADNGAPPYSYRETSDDECGYQLTGGFILGRQKVQPLQQPGSTSHEAASFTLGRDREERFRSVMEYSTFQHFSTQLCITRVNNNIYLYATKSCLDVPESIT